MIYPAPQYMTTTAWMMGQITDEEAEEMFREWREITELTSEEEG